MFNARISHAINHACNWNDGDIMYSGLEALLQREASPDVVIYCFGPQKSAFICNLIDRQLLIHEAQMSSVH
jgi:hypothetical protein